MTRVRRAAHCCAGVCLALFLACWAASAYAAARLGCMFAAVLCERPLYNIFALYRFFDDRPTSIDVERALETPAPDRGGPAGCGTLAVATREDADFFGGLQPHRGE